MTEVQVAHTAQLDAAALGALHAMLDRAFDGELTAEDFEHALGGLHAIVWEDGEPIAHGAVVLRRLLHRGRALRCGYVEAVAVRADRRRRGHGSAVMDRLEPLIRGGHDLGALGASDVGAALYVPRGWRRWRGPTSALTPTGIRRTPDDDGGVYVLPGEAPLDLDADLTCDWRDGDVW